MNESPDHPPLEPITQRLLAWYRRHGRDLPWRRTRDPYAVWVSEVMLQQTQVATVIPYYLAFLNRFPSVEALALADPDQVLKAWENLGYYRRARNLHRAAGMLMEDHGGRLPRDRKALLALPGIGPYIADAVLSIAFGFPRPAVDGNVRRVVARLAGIRTAPDVQPGRGLLERTLENLLPQDRPGAFNQALMDFGSAICLAKKPDCGSCFLQDLCAAHGLGQVPNIPLTRPRRVPPRRPAAAAVIQDDQGRYLLTRRPENGLLGGLWQWPGGLTDPDRDIASALGDLVEKEIGIPIRVGPELARVTHRFTHLEVEVRVFEGTLDRLGSVPEESAERTWAGSKDLAELALANLDRKILRSILTGTG